MRGGTTMKNDLPVKAGLILFVHGLGGDSHATWGNFPELITKDEHLSKYHVEFFGYPTSILRLPFSRKYSKIQLLAEGLRTKIETNFTNYTDIILVCHSLGGLIAKKYLIEEVKRNGDRLRVKALLLFAVPNNGARLASVANMVSWRHYQLRQLCKNSDVITDISSDWFTYKIHNKVRVKYVVAALDHIVDEIGAKGFWGNPDSAVILDRNHIDVVKPKDSSDMPFCVLKEFVVAPVISAQEEPRKLIELYATKASLRRSAATPVGSKFRVIGFDLDGTLLKGLDYSWQIVWAYLDFEKEVQRTAKQRYHRGEINYAEWCKWCCTQFRTKGLRRVDFIKMASKVTVTKKLHEAIRILRSNGFVLAIISGGIDVFLDEKIPDAHDLFDYICINRFIFDDQGIICDIQPTPFDFDQKAVALKAICQKKDVTLEKSVFVGDGPNDEWASRAAGLCIAYPPKEMSHIFEIISKIKIDEDDLTKILPHIL